MDKKVEALQEELQQVKAENNALRLMLEVQSSKYNNLQSCLQEIINNKVGNSSNKSGSVELVPNLYTNKRAGLEFPTIAKRPLQVYVRTDPKDDSLIIKDGYQWRKYGQKVTKDNASPRAYFRCSMAPSCPAKKKVQRYIHDRSILVATYDGEHNHGAIHESLVPSSSTPKASMANNLPLTITSNGKEDLNIDHLLSTDTRICEDIMQQCDHNNNIKIDEYVSSIIKDPDFTEALAEAVARSIIDQPKQRGLNLNLGLRED